MSCYFLARDDDEALGARNAPGGPLAGGGFDALAAGAFMATPHFELLVASANRTRFELATSGFVPVWPDASEPTPPGGDPGGPSIQRVPDSLRDQLASLAIDARVGEEWAREVWGVQPDEALDFAQAVTALARSAKASGRHIYWWMEL